MEKRIIGSRGNEDTGNITIAGGKVTATGGSDGVGIGARSRGAASNITISGGTVAATGGSGSWYGIQGTDLRIVGGSVKAGDSGSDIYRGAWNNDWTERVYLLTIPNPNGEAVYVDGEQFRPNNHKAADSGDTNLYAWVTGEDHVVRVGEQLTSYTFNGRNLKVVTKSGGKAKLSWRAPRA